MNKVRSSCLTVVSALLVVVGLSSTTYGAWKATGNTTNYISTAEYGSKILNEFNPPETVKPDTYVKDIVKVKNVGDTPILTRVSFSRSFEDKDLSGDNIILDIDSEHWYDGGDGYYYYKGILDGDEISEKVLKGFTLESKVNEEYKSQAGSIEAVAESIQYYGDFLEEVWGIKYSDLGIKKPEEKYTLETSTVVFNGSTFEYNGDSSDDLFLDFKNMVSGSARTQPIKITNSSNIKANIKLSTMFSKDTEEKLKEMMYKYVTISIKDKDGNSLYNGAVGGGSGVEVDLGNFNVGESKDFIVTINVSRDIDTNYSDLKGSVEWGFTVNDLTVYLAKTSDTYWLYIGVALLLIGTTGFVLSSRKRKGVVA